jgi:hypothetical protein
MHWGFESLFVSLENGVSEKRGEVCKADRHCFYFLQMDC